MSGGEQQQIEQALAALAANDTASALSVLARAYGQRLEHMIGLRLDRRLAGRVDPADILQDSFIEILSKLPDFKQDRQVSLFVWMRTIVLERITSTHRRHLNADMRDVRRERDFINNLNPNESAWSLAQVLLSNDTSISGRAIRAEQHNQLADALTCLEEIDREIILLRIFENMSNQEAALTLQLEPSAASKRFIRAMDRLAEILRSFPGCDSALFVRK